MRYLAVQWTIRSKVSQSPQVLEPGLCDPVAHFILPIHPLHLITQTTQALLSPRPVVVADLDEETHVIQQSAIVKNATNRGPCSSSGKFG